MENEILKVIGNTPLIKVDGINFKLETTNPTGSIKDRMTSYIIQKAEKSKELKNGQKIIEATSGNTGISFAWISAIRGYKFQAIMPESMSKERRKIIKVFGGDLILTPAQEDMEGTIKRYNFVKKNNPDAWFPRQFKNNNNIKAYEKGFAQEILRQTKGKIDAFIASAGTGGSLVGTAKVLKKINPKTKIFAIEPEESAVLSGKKAGLHKIQGIGEGFVPRILQDNLNLIDGFITVSSQKALESQKYLIEKKGLLVGVSSGANYVGAQKIKKDYKNIVSIFPDRGERYLN